MVAGLLGIGGGVIVVPALALILPHAGVHSHHIMHFAVGTSLASIVFTTGMSSFAHHRRGNVDWYLALRLGPGMMAGAIVAGFLAGYIPANALRAVYILFVSLVALRTFARLESPESWQVPSTRGLLTAGGLMGSVATWVGVGGGVLNVPFLTATHVPMKRAIGTSASLGAPHALCGALGFVLSGQQSPDLPPGALGFVYLPALAGMVVFSVSMATIGARLTDRVPTSLLQKLFAILLLMGAVKMALDISG